MKKIFLLSFFFSFNVFALEAVVTVLETPMLQEKSLDAKVVQYLRKGDVIKIHPSVGNDPRFDEYAPLEGYDAPEGTSFRTDPFIPTLDRQGNTVYVISDHLHVYYGDSREFSEPKLSKDPTDYRLEEPLPKNYPLPVRSGYRGLFYLGVSQPNYESYDYQDSVRMKGYQSPLNIGITLLRFAPGDHDDRLFIGGSLFVKSFKNTYYFGDQRISREESLTLGIGPTISYDGYKGEKDRLNLNLSLLCNIFDQMEIKQKLSGVEENRLYSGYSFASNVSLQYHRKNIFDEIDFVLGTGVEITLPSTLNAKNGGGTSAWWNNLGNDSIKRRTSYSLTAFMGLQSSY